ncbi:putative N-acetyltransferase YsnE [Actinomadura rubteroloni]|uniref:Putative N-acetyltransferase YsnE n=1 Tax=Actinomadura rubteroloni TaxID=1926885 RepID=A0A2P4UP64_9ACTN|nr:GNAT family N-acetyltransferase [Actinomadura rubteroloni]POM26847.1 putative N-acetyltransferase YsnE [Actinomadura rubteroloni]
MKILQDDLTSPEIAEFLHDHLEDMRALSPPESVHALDLAALRSPDITFWTVTDGDSIAACGALKHLTPTHAELKSMRTAPTHHRTGLASRLLTHIINEATARNYTRLSLETGSTAPYLPARRLYEKFGFTYCAPFADYKPDPNSVHMTKPLQELNDNYKI